MLGLAPIASTAICALLASSPAPPPSRPSVGSGPEWTEYSLAIRRKRLQQEIESAENEANYQAWKRKRKAAEVAKRKRQQEEEMVMWMLQ